jgi:hypothetical protein
MHGIGIKLLKNNNILSSHSELQKVICLRLAYFSRWDDTLGVSCDYDLARKAVVIRQRGICERTAYMLRADNKSIPINKWRTP